MRQAGEVLFCEIIPEPGTVRDFNEKNIRLNVNVQKLKDRSPKFAQICLFASKLSPSFRQSFFDGIGGFGL